MKKLRLGVGGALMAAVTLLSDGGAILSVFYFAALLHELGHLLASRLLGIGIKEIRLGFSGVRIVTNEGMSSYFDEIVLALSGPLANITVFCAAELYFLERGGVMALFRAAEGYIFADGGSFSELWGVFCGRGAGKLNLSGAVAFLGLSSLIQAAFNLLPIRSFDGGRALYCTAALLFGEGIAQRSVSIMTWLSALLLWILALYLLLRTSAGLGIFVFAVCVFWERGKWKVES